MSVPVSRAEIIGALLKKELIAYSRNTLYLALSAVVLVMVIVMFWVIPDTVDESISLAVSPPISTLIENGVDDLRALGATEEQLAELQGADLTSEQEGLELIELDSADELSGVVEGSLEAWRTTSDDVVVIDPNSEVAPDDSERLSLDIGIAFPPNFIGAVATGDDDIEVTVYSDAAVPAEIEGAMTSFVRETGYQLAGRELPVTMPDEDSIVLGTDRAGEQISLRDRLIPMLAFMVLMMETFSMGSLISIEVLQRTATAVLVTPARISDFLTAKTIFGTGLALVQGLIVLVFVQAFTAENWPVLLAAVVLGALMFTGIAMVVGAAGKDFIGQLFYSMAFVLPLIVPAFAVLFPGSTAPWVRVLPSYPVINMLVEGAIYNTGFSAVWGQFAYGLAWVVALYGAGLLALKRKVESL